MPKVKTVAPGRLTGISGLTRTAAESVGRQKDMEFAFEMSEWQKQRARLEKLQQQETDLITERMKTITSAEGVGDIDFNVGLKDSLMGQARDYARINSRMQLGDIDVAEGAKDLALIDKQLNTFIAAAPNVEALYNVVTEADGKIAGEVGSILIPTDVETAKKQNGVIGLIKTLYSSNSGNIKTEFKNGQTILTGEDGTKISLDGLNDIMTGENPEYPIQFVQSPDAAIQPLYQEFSKRTKDLEGYKKKRSVEVENADGSTETIVKKMYEIGEDSKYRKDLKEVVSPILDDKKAMETYWPNLKGGQKSGPWLNKPEQREEALNLLVERADSLYGPKVDVITSPSGETTYEDIVSEEYKEKSELEKLKIKKAKKDLSTPSKTKPPIKINEEDKKLYNYNVRSAKQALIVAKKQGKKAEAKFIARVLNKRAIKPGEVKDYSFKLAADVYDKETLKNENIDPNSIYIIKGEEEQLYPIDMSNEDEILRVFNSESGFEDEYLEALKIGGMRSGDFEIKYVEKKEKEKIEKAKKNKDKIVPGKYEYSQTTFRPTTEEEFDATWKAIKPGSFVIFRGKKYQKPKN